jgi:DNA polymerase I-like protein with 3'-5' exonuclease and polymerase domains
MLGWNLKELITYFKFHLNNKAEIKFTAKVVDLRLIEAFSGQNLSAPESLKQAIKRMGAIRDNTKAKTIHNKIHKPLLMDVIPSMETQGVLHTELKRRVYPYYEIETHVNGRLKSSKAFPLSVNTHGLTEAEKEKLKLRSDEEMFVYFDFNSMEVAMLQYLSGDTALAEVLATGDCYKNMWNLLFNSPCETLAQRQFIKECFLPVVFGMGNNTIVERTGCSENAAAALSKGLRTRFKQAFEYVTQFQGSTSAEDFFGRRRVFDDARPHVVRNFVVQAPAAIVCMEKLIDLYQIVDDKLLFSIHDGYVIRCNPKFDKPLIVKCKKALEAPSKLAPGLHLSINCEIGVRLHKMKQLKI